MLDSDRSELARRLLLPETPIGVLNPGATDPRRRWPAGHFAAVGDALAVRGAIVLSGSPEERKLTGQVAKAMRAPAVDAGGALSLPALNALLGDARLVVANDTGPLHLAQALGTTTVGVYWLANLLVFAPLEQRDHRQAVSVEARCSVCGAENLTSRCAHDPSFVSNVTVETVTALALELWEARASTGDVVCDHGRR